MDNGTDAMGFEDSPDEEGETSSGYKVCFDSKQVADFVDWEPDRRKRSEPKEEKGDIVASVRTLRWEGVGKIFVAGPDRAEHQRNALT